MAILKLAVLTLLLLISLIRSQDRVAGPSDFDRGEKQLCKIEINGIPATRRDPAKIKTFVQCGEDVLYDEETPLEELEQTELQNGLKLFVDDSEDGFAYVYIDGGEFNIDDSFFRDLTEVPSLKMAAPIVIVGGDHEITYCSIERNDGEFLSGGMIVKENASIELKEVSFRDNVGEYGAFWQKGASDTDFEYCDFRRNNGTEVGALKAGGASVLRMDDCVFEENFGAIFSNEMYLTEQVTYSNSDSKIIGRETHPDFKEFLLDPSRPDNELDEFELPMGAVVVANGQSFGTLINCRVSGHSGRFGAVYVAEKAVFQSRSNEFVGNRAFVGGGIYANSARGGYVGIIRSDFRDNLARNGGGLVISGNGSYALDFVRFENNRAVNGGAVWGDYRETNGACPRASSGARLDILNSSFVGNMAQNHGGAFFIKCTNIYAEDSVFEGNTAVEGDGGSINAENTFDIHFINVSLSNGMAGGSGGGIFVVDSNEVILENSFLLKNSAVQDGGTVASIKGKGIILTDTVLEGSSSGRHGGAVFASDIASINFFNSSVKFNNAGGTGGVIYGSNVDSLMWAMAEVQYNEASMAGAVYIEGGSQFNLENMLFSDNMAKDSDSGVVHLDGVVNATIYEVDFLTNIAIQSCGAVSINNASNVEISQSTLSGNEGDRSGGALCLSRVNKTEFVGVEFDSNRANGGDGGALMVSDCGSMRISESTFSNNNSTESGGAILLSKVESVEVIEKTNVINSTAGKDGGCMFSRSVSSLRLADILMFGCLSDNGGGVVVTGRSKVVGEKTTFQENTARNEGGAVVCDQETEVTFKDSTFYHNAAPEGSTLNADCRCKVDIRESTIYRDDKRPNNGDFFAINDACSELFGLGNDYFGGPRPSNELEWYEWTGVAAGTAITAFVILLLFNYCRRRMAEKGVIQTSESKDLEASSAEEESGEDEEGEEEESEEGSEEESDEEDDEEENKRLPS